MKKIVKIIIGAVVLVAVLYGGNLFMNRVTNSDGSDLNVEEVATKQFVGEVVRNFEGDHLLGYSLNIPETATATLGLDGALVTVTDGDMPYLSMYVSYEGGRGYSPSTYIDRAIAPLYSVVDLTGTTTIGGFEWQGAESMGIEWHVASVADGQWLVVIENKKSMSDMVKKAIESLKLN